ncbi:hypothetical protein WS90_06445 [Burkholderia cepacia]|uniref:Uncharacterized protein n=1 Tax=Burkholderia cepacia TaxID=292 RepID=A0A103ZU07_BURCE|nr:hypothetical protein WS90_06445 [Burkholderia cepacia]
MDTILAFVPNAIKMTSPGAYSLFVQTQFVLNPPCPLALGPQAKNRCPISVRDLSIRAGQRATALRAKTFFSRLLVAAQPLAKRRPGDATTRAHETGVAGLVIHAHPM